MQVGSLVLTDQFQSSLHAHLPDHGIATMPLGLGSRF